MSEGTKIFNLLQNIRQSVKSAALDAPTSHPSGDAPDGDTVATEGSQSAANEASMSENLGATAADNKANENPQKLPEPVANQAELAPGSVDQAPPAEIAPSETKPSEEPGSINEKVAHVQAELTRYLSEVSAIIPVIKQASEQAPEQKDASELEKEAAEASELEKLASATLQNMLASQNVSPNAPEEVKRAALVKAAKANAEAAFAGFALTFDNNVMTKIARGDYSFIKSAGDEVLPDDTGGAAPAGDPTAMAAPAGDPAAAAGGAAPSEDELIQEVLAMVDRGELPPDQLVAALQAMGVSEQKIQEVVQLLSQAGQQVGGAEGAAPEAAPEAAPAPQADEASDAAVESAKTASMRLVRQALNQILA